MKKLLRLDIRNSGFYPDITELLRLLPPEILFHNKYPFRHPAAIYQLSLRQLAIDFERVLNGYTAIRLRSGSNETGEQLCHSQRILIYSLREHIDDCQMILMCLIDPGVVAGRGRSPEETLKAAGFPERQIFWTGIHNYADSYIMPMVNALKHGQGRLRALIFECSAQDRRPGFYLEEVDERGVAQPSKKLHGGNTAFSFTRDIRANLAWVFRAAESLKTAINAFLKRAGAFPLLTPEGAAVTPGLWTEVCKRVAELDTGVFPQELKIRFVQFKLYEGALRIREMERYINLSFPVGRSTCHTQTLGDGMTRSFRMPYFKESGPK